MNTDEIVRENTMAQITTQEAINELHRMRKHLMGAQGCSVGHQQANSYSVMCLRLAIDALKAKQEEDSLMQTWMHEVQLEKQAAIKDLEELMSEVGLVNYVTCAYCQLPDDYTCLGEDGKCKAKWRGPGKTEGNSE